MAETYRTVAPRDFGDLFAIASDWQTVRQLGGWKWPPDAEQIRDRSRAYEGDGFVWAICRDDRLIGTIGIIRGDLGYVLSPAFHRQGIVGRAAREAVALAFERERQETLTASTWHDNPASDRLLRSLGFRHWQTHYTESVARGGQHLLRRYRLTRADWLRLKQPA